MYDLTACNRELFKKLLLLCFIFAIRIILQILWKIFLISSLYIFEKKTFLLRNIANKYLIRKKMYVCKDSLNLDCKDNIRFDTWKTKGHLRRLSPSHFLQNVLIETSCVCFKTF